MDYDGLHDSMGATIAVAWKPDELEYGSGFHERYLQIAMHYAYRDANRSIALLRIESHARPLRFFGKGWEICMAAPLSRKTNETQPPPNETPIYREFQTRIREEDLTEEQLSVREKELKILSEKVSTLYYQDARRKASNKQCAIYEEFGMCLTSLTEISRSM